MFSDCATPQQPYLSPKRPGLRHLLALYWSVSSSATTAWIITNNKGTGSYIDPSDEVDNPKNDFQSTFSRDNSNVRASSVAPKTSMSHLLSSKSSPLSTRSKVTFTLSKVREGYLPLLYSILKYFQRQSNVSPLDRVRRLRFLFST